jgi:hypothetical protein
VRPHHPNDGEIAIREARRRVSQARRDALRRRTSAAAEWDRINPVRPDRREFTEQILPGLVASGISISGLSRRVGQSRRYVKMILNGEAVPQLVHWASFRESLPTGGCSVLAESAEKGEEG